MTQDDLWVVPMTMDTSPLGLPGGLEPALGGVHVGGLCLQLYFSS